MRRTTCAAGVAAVLCALVFAYAPSAGATSSAPSTTSTGTTTTSTTTTTTTGPASPAAPKPAPAPVRHVIQPHDTIRSVAARYHLDWHALARWNQLAAPYTLHPEGVLRLTPPAQRLAPFTTTVSRPAPEQTHWRAGCPVPFADLRLVWVTYIDFDGATHQGYVVVAKSIATKVQKLFHTLYDARYRIQAMAPMAVNSPRHTAEDIATLAYNCRPVTNGGSYSQHAFGTAIDINPAQNPEITAAGEVFPETATAYKNRSSYRMAIIHSGGTVVRTLAAAGLSWGGSWHSLKDYMHFSANGR